MMTTLLKTVEMTRQIRQQHYECLKDKTPAERLAFYRKKAQELHAAMRLTRPPSELRPYTEFGDGVPAAP